MKKYLIIFVIFLLLGCQKPVEQPAFTMETYPRIDGSTVTIPLSEAICAKLTNQTVEQVRPYILHTKTHSAYVNLIDKKTDLIFVTYPSIDEFKYASDQGVELEIIPIVSEAFVFLTHKNNPVESLTFKQIQDIYTGKITNWKEVGGPDVPIIAYQRPVNSGSQTGFLDLVMKDLTPMNPPTEWVMAGMGELIEAVATYQNQPDAIGYSYYYFVVDMWGNENVRLMKVDNVYPDSSTITSKQYPIVTNYYAVFRKSEPADSNVRKVVEWILSDAGQTLAEDTGYVKVR